MKTIRIAAAVLVGTAFFGNAQAQYQPYPYNQIAQQPQYQPPYNAVPVIPPSWSYNPYTSGFGPCPQGQGRDLLRCSEQMPPTYGQPDYRTR